MPAPLPRPALIIAGPTAVGKSALALQLAQNLNGEIISVDSMQVYRGLNIGTAKPSPTEQALVPHHLIDIVGPTEPFDAAKFLSQASLAESDLRFRGKLPIFCGGTGLYFKALMQGLEPASGADFEYREEISKLSHQELLEHLKSADPIAYERIDRHNPRRVLRALEIIHATGRPMSAQRSDYGAPSESKAAPSRFIQIGITRERDDLYARINARVDIMFTNGLLRETEALLALGLAQNPTAMQAIGYRQVVEHLRGERSLEETIALIKQKTRQFAKRQLTWFKGQMMKLEWLPLNDHASEEAAVAKITHRVMSPR